MRVTQAITHMARIRNNRVWLRRTRRICDSFEGVWKRKNRRQNAAIIKPIAAPEVNMDADISNDGAAKKKKIWDATTKDPPARKSVAAPPSDTSPVQASRSLRATSAAPITAIAGFRGVPR